MKYFHSYEKISIPMKKCICSSLSTVMSLLKKAHYNYHTWFFQWETLEQSTLILRRRGSGWKTFKTDGKWEAWCENWWGSRPMSLWGIHDYVWKIVEIKRNSQGLQESRCHSCLQEGQGGYMEWQMKHPLLKPWKSNGETSPGNYFLTHKGQEDHGQAARICNAWPPCKEVTGSVHEGRAADVFNPDLYKTCSTDSHNILMVKLMK